MTKEKASEGKAQFQMIPQLVAKVARELPALDARRAGAELYGAPRLNAFTLFDPGENSISRVLQDLLDPFGAHGQGALFLNELLLGLNLPAVRSGDAVEVRREASTPHGRRIDLVVDTPRVLLGLENKPWAGQQVRQLSDYLDALTGWARGRATALVFLSGQEPESAAGRVHVVRFVEDDEAPSLRTVLAATINRIRAPRARLHVEEFIAYLDEQFGDTATMDASDEPYVDAVTEEFDGVDRRRSIAAVMLTGEALHHRIVDEVGEHILTQLRTHFSDMVEEDDDALSACLCEKHCHWGLRRPSWPDNLHVALEADRNGFGGIYFGVRAPDPKSKDARANGDDCAVRSRVDAATRSVGPGRTTVYWSWWGWTRTKLWDARQAARFVLHAPDGRVGDHQEIVELTDRLTALALAVDAAVDG